MVGWGRRSELRAGSKESFVIIYWRLENEIYQKIFDYCLSVDHGDNNY